MFWGQQDWARRGRVSWLQQAPSTACRPHLQTLFLKQGLSQKILGVVVLFALGLHWPMSCVSPPAAIRTDSQAQGCAASVTQMVT